MAKKAAKDAGSEFICPSCKAEVKPTFGTITGIAPQKCKCGKYLVIYMWFAAIVWGACIAVWYGIFLLSGVVLPLIVQIILLPVWAFFGYRLLRKVVFRFVKAKEMK
ncbi:hypothetical protein [uncultured Acetobacteroides sp.]|uniref:hypothetical protein n=1 Tax=uncultured Acetobacteroides sp. TaxID=1760811 RepID=UPI0029F59103|nr:hypothetical protein [uncultured Acetobacteroides sp.]